MCAGNSGKPENQQEKSEGSLLSRVVNRWAILKIFPIFENGSREMRERILLSAILIGIIFSGLAAVPAILLALRERLWIPLTMDFVVFSCGLGLLFARKLSYEFRAWTACALIYIVGVYVVFFFGFLSGGPTWLFSFAVLCGLLLGVKSAITGICVNFLTLGILAWLHSSTSLGDGVPFFATWLNALAAAGNFLFLNTLVAISCALLIRDEKEISLSLKNEKVQLLKAKRRLEEEIVSRKEAEKKQFEIARELQESEARFRQLVNNAPAGIYEMDLKNFVITNVNDVMCGYTGYTKDEFLTLNPLSLLAKESVEYFVERGKAVFAGQSIPESTEYKIRRKDGSAFWARSHSRVTYSQGTPVKSTMVLHDITDVKTLEEEKKQLQESLLEARKMEAIGTLAGGIAHQFNNALSVVSVSMDMLELCREAGNEYKKYTEMVRNSIERMTGLTSQLLAYARGGKYYSRTVYLSRFIADTLPALLAEIPASIKVETDLHQDVLPVKADPNQMKSVLSTILTNAAEAMEEGGTVRILCANQRIEEGDLKAYPDLVPGLYAALTIEDNGKGMDKQTLGRIFDPFFTTKFQGRGLAMPAVSGIVRNHGGWIHVDSEEGKGTTVRILLPVFEE